MSDDALDWQTIVDQFRPLPSPRPVLIRCPRHRRRRSEQRSRSERTQRDRIVERLADARQIGRRGDPLRRLGRYERRHGIDDADEPMEARLDLVAPRYARILDNLLADGEVVEVARLADWSGLEGVVD